MLHESEKFNNYLNIIIFPFSNTIFLSKIFAFLILSLLPFAVSEKVTVANADESDDLEEIQKDIEEKKDELKETNEKLDEIKSKADRITATLNSLSGKLGVTKAQLNSVQAQINDLNEDIANYNKKLEIQQKELNSKLVIRNQTIRNLYISNQKPDRKSVV